MGRTAVTAVIVWLVIYLVVSLILFIMAFIYIGRPLVNFLQQLHMKIVNADSMFFDGNKKITEMMAIAFGAVALLYWTIDKIFGTDLCHITKMLGID